MGGRHVAYLYLLSGRADVFVLYGTVDRSRALRKKIRNARSGHAPTASQRSFKTSVKINGSCYVILSTGHLAELVPDKQHPPKI